MAFMRSPVRSRSGPPTSNLPRVRRLPRNFRSELHAGHQVTIGCDVHFGAFCGRFVRPTISGDEKAAEKTVVEEVSEMAKEFSARQLEDFEIQEDGEVVGTLRVKPSGVLWAPKGSHYWYRVGIDQFGDYAKEKG